MEISLHEILFDNCKIPKRIQICDSNYRCIAEHDIYRTRYDRGSLELYLKGHGEMKIPGGYYAELDGNTLTLKPDPDYYDIMEYGDEDLDIYKIELMDNKEYRKFIESIPGTIIKVDIDFSMDEITVVYEMVKILKINKRR